MPRVITQVLAIIKMLWKNWAELKLFVDKLMMIKKTNCLRNWPKFDSRIVFSKISSFFKDIGSATVILPYFVMSFGNLIKTAYINQLNGKRNEAMTGYNLVMDTSQEALVSALASHNLGTMDQDTKILDSRKKMKPLQATNVDSKLTKDQKLKTKVCFSIFTGGTLKRSKKYVEENLIT